MQRYFKNLMKILKFWGIIAIIYNCKIGYILFTIKEVLKVI